MAKKDRPEDREDKILDVDARMQGTVVFKDPVNLRINGSFEGKLDTRGNLTGKYFFHFLALICLQTDDARKALFFPGC